VSSPGTKNASKLAPMFLSHRRTLLEDSQTNLLLYLHRAPPDRVMRARTHARSHPATARFQTPSRESLEAPVCRAARSPHP
jgi:hypothetical protein